MTRTLWSHRWYHGPPAVNPDTGEEHWPTHREIDVQIEPRDVWVGVYWQSYPSERELWICPVPCLVLHVWWSRRHRANYRPPKDLRATEAPARLVVEHHPAGRP